MQLVYIPGVWDLLHIGHIRILQKAKDLGEILIVGVPSDEVVREDKGQLPIIPLDQRLEMLQSVRWVSLALPYYKLSFMSHLELYKPSVLVVGEMWGTQDRHIEAEKWAEDNNCRLLKLPYTHEVSTSTIRHRIVEQHGGTNARNHT